MKEKLTLKEVRDCFELYKAAFNKKPYISNLANELRIKTTELMKFIVENDKHFVLYQNDKGTYISQIYLDLRYKPGSDEFVECRKEKYKNTLFLDTYSYPYTRDVVFHRLRVDEKDEERGNEWRNTIEKIEKVKDFLAETYVTNGDYLDKYSDYIPKDEIELLISQGWEFKNYDKNSSR